MKKRNLASIVLGAALMSGTAAMANNNQMKCGAGKCGGNMQPKTQQPAKCGAGGNMGQGGQGQQDQNRTRNPQAKCGAAAPGKQ